MPFTSPRPRRHHRRGDAQHAGRTAPRPGAEGSPAGRAHSLGTRLVRRLRRRGATQAKRKEACPGRGETAPNLGRRRFLYSKHGFTLGLLLVCTSKARAFPQRLQVRDSCGTHLAAQPPSAPSSSAQVRRFAADFEGDGWCCSDANAEKSLINYIHSLTMDGAVQMPTPKSHS
jgi:hypothetical protein